MYTCTGVCTKSIMQMYAPTYTNIFNLKEVLKEVSLYTYKSVYTVNYLDDFTSF